MEALKLKGKINESGQLILSESVKLSPGEVEIIILKPAKTTANHDESFRTNRLMTTPANLNSSSGEYTIKALSDWFANLPPQDPNFDADEARWQALKEKHNL